MKPRHLLSTVLLAAAAVPLAYGHFVFVVPTPDGRHATVVLSEDLKPDDAVPPDLLAGAKLAVTDAAGHDLPVVTTKGEHAYAADLPGAGTRIVHGTCDVGVRAREGAKSYLLIYHPKAVLGDPFDASTRLPAATPIELVPIGAPGQVRFRLLAAGKPVVGAEVTVIPPGGDEAKVTTDARGETPTTTAPGRYGLWAKVIDATPGDRDGKHYDEVRHYATLVVDVPAAAAIGPTTGPATRSAFASGLAPLPQTASSFGAVAAGGWLYVYGGHVVPTHHYNTGSVSGQFHRLNLADGKTWETLPGGPALQGMNLAAVGTAIVRVGGMHPRNAAGQPDDVRSVADVAAYDPAAGRWADLPPLPQPRSSHDVAVVAGKLYVFGGWNLTGNPDDAKWADTALVLDPAAPAPQWKTLKQPFQRRALIAAVHRGKVYVLGGFDSNDDPSLRVDVYDPAADAWADGPDLPGPQKNGFGPAAAAVGDDLLVSVADGSLYRLDDAAGNWAKVAATTPRIVHRMVPAGRDALILGGAAGTQQLDLIERVAVPAR